MADFSLAWKCRPFFIDMRALNLILLIVCFWSFSAKDVLAELSETAHQDLLDSSAVVAVKVNGRSDFCSGVVVAENEILTAAHCVYNLAAQDYFAFTEVRIGIGENIFDEGFYWMPIAGIETDAAVKIQTTNDYLFNDVVRLKMPASLPVKPLSVAKTLDSNSRLYAWGFGEDQWGYVGIRKSRVLENPIVDSKLISFSAGACRGDSGGPILNDSHQVVGIVSMSEVPHCVDIGKRMAQRVWPK